MALTAEQKVSQTFIDELLTIAGQLETAKGSSAEDRSVKRALDAMSSKLDTEDIRTRLYNALDVRSEDIDPIVNQLSAWAEAMVPEANVTWDKPTVTSKLTILQQFRSIGYLTAEQIEIVDTLKDRFNVKASGGNGERAERTAQEAIPGRPEKVAITDAGGNVFSTQKGNVSTTCANLKTRVGLYIKQTTGETMPAEVGKAVLAAAKKVVEDGEPTAEFAGFTFSSVA